MVFGNWFLILKVVVVVLKDKSIYKDFCIVLMSDFVSTRIYTYIDMALWSKNRTEMNLL